MDVDLASNNTTRSVAPQPKKIELTTKGQRRKGKKEGAGSGGGSGSAGAAAGDEGQKKRRCISSACVPCRRRKSKCDGSTPSCSACAAVYNTECVYDPNSDHRRKGVYKKDIDNLKTRNSTLQTLIQAILNWEEEEALELVRRIRTCESLDGVAEGIIRRDNGEDEEDNGGEEGPVVGGDYAMRIGESGARGGKGNTMTFESQLSGKMGELRLEDGSTRYIGGTSNLIYLGAGAEDIEGYDLSRIPDLQNQQYLLEQQHQQDLEDPITSWTTVTSDPKLVMHLLDMYFAWHYTFFTTLSKSLFYQDFRLGRPLPGSRRKTEYCTPLLVNAMLALGCHFTSWPAARAIQDDSATAGDHFFKEAKRLILEGDLHEVPRLTTVQALALMSVREAGCGREAKGWVYSGMSFRMACDLGLNLDSGGMQRSGTGGLEEGEEDARRITFWGCFLFDKCWSNYLGRLPQLPKEIITVQKFEVFPVEDADIWSAYTDSGFSQAHAQPSRTRAVARQISLLCEISSDLMNYFYNPIDMDKAKGKQAELKKLSDIHQRLEKWKRELPKEMEPKEGGLPHILVMHMFFQILYIHLFRPFLKYKPSTSPLPANASPRKYCTQAAQTISKLLRLYRRSHGLRQICNIAVYIAHSACTIHLLNLPEKNARRDIVHGVKHLEEIAEGWICARRTLGILSVLARRWGVELPEEARVVLERTDRKFGAYSEVGTPRTVAPSLPAASPETQQQQEYQSPGVVFEAETALPVYSTGTLEPASRAFHYAQPPQLQQQQQLQKPPNTSSGSNSNILHRRLPSENPSLPPTDSHTLSLPRIVRHPSDPHNALTPVSNSAPQRQSMDSTNVTGLNDSTGNSPSQFFGGVDQLMRETQDWLVRDQSQLASGFGNWEERDFAWLETGMGQGLSQGGGSMNAVRMEIEVGAGGSPVGFEYSGSGGTPGGGLSVNRVNGGMNGLNGYGGALSAYNENEWYQ
ncbi:hypothetical protein GQ43DRAFT_399445 [Delitschia confertaspora ATCC 74209]|uniref:Zn(2)-C6 fungal-type domain-containing protein n=1 Tax=Delitschia confertaspora ATCC 74209 TaxID=1513339 RepID=A0A9P4JLS2_9PLEO|nr:hypothetical protein GQ43DRAFT_399445 [Delitschia confertaspora ATCC 74209]